MTERAQALEAAREWQIAAYGDSPETWAALAFYRERDWPVDVNTFPERERVADRISAFKAGYREALAVQPPPPVGSPTTAHVAPIVGKVWTHHDGVLPDGSVCRTADVDALIAERTAQLQAALFDEQASHEATKCRLVAAEQSHEAAGNRVIELLKSTPVEPAGAHVETLRQMVGMAGEFRQTLLTVRECIDALTPGHRTGYDWNADPLYMTRYVGDALKAIDAGLKSLNGQAAVPTYRNVYIVTHYPDGGLRGVHASQAGAEAEIADLCREYPEYSRRDFSITCDRIRPFVEPAGASEPPMEREDVGQHPARVRRG